MVMDRNDRIENLFHEAIERDACERTAYLRGACASDSELLAAVESLITAYERAPASLEDPVLDLRAACRTDASFSSRAPLDAPIHRQVGAYTLLEQIGSGGMGAVWSAQRADGRYERKVAIKFVHGCDSDHLLRRFRLEQRTLGSLEHPYIARLLDAGTTDLGAPYFMMEYVDGARIDRYCDEARLGIEQRLRLFRRVCEAVAHAHGKLVVHRDLKPGNILVDKDGSPKLLDFGIAKIMDDDGQNGDQTRATSRAFTPEYASPEQARGEPVTTASDVFSLGAVLYELLTGQRLRRAAVDVAPSEFEPTKPSTVMSHLLATSAKGDDEGKAIAASLLAARGGHAESLRRRLTGDVDMIVLKALRAEPQRRYSSVEQFSDDIRRHLEHLPIIARPDTWRYRGRKFVRRNRALVAGTAIGFVGLLATTIGTSIGRAQALSARREAERQASIAEAVNQFLNKDLLASADPKKSLGREVTVREVLDNASKAIEGKFPGEPLVEAAVRMTLGETYYGLGDFERAAGHVQRVVKIRETELGPTHPTTMGPMNALGEMYRAQGLYGKAEPWLLRALELRREKYGDEHPETLNSLHNLAGLYQTQGRHQKAAPLLERTVKLRRQLQGEEHPDTIACTVNLGLLYQNLCRFDEAERLTRQTLELSTRLNGPEHPTTLLCTNNLAFMYLTQKRYAEAEKLLTESLETRRRVLGETHVQTLISTHNLARTLGESGRLEDAASLFEEFMRIAPSALPPRHDLLGVAKGVYGDFLTRLGRYDEAERELLEGYNSLRESQGPKDGRTLKVVQSLVELYDAWGRSVQAGEYRAMLKGGPPTDL